MHVKLCSIFTKGGKLNSSMRTAYIPVRGWIMLEMPSKIETDERWRLLCKRASTESDPHKLLELVQEIIRLTAKEIPMTDRSLDRSNKTGQDELSNWLFLWCGSDTREGLERKTARFCKSRLYSVNVNSSCRSRDRNLSRSRSMAIALHNCRRRSSGGMAVSYRTKVDRPIPQMPYAHLRERKPKTPPAN